MRIGSRPQQLAKGARVSIRRSTYGIAKAQADAMNREARNRQLGIEWTGGLSPKVLAMMEADAAMIRARNAAADAAKIKAGR